MTGSDIAGVVISFLICVSLIVMGIFLKKGKGSFLIAGYNTMPKKERLKYDEPALCRFVGRLLIFIALLMPIITLGALLKLVWLCATGVGMMLIICAGALIFANTGNRFRN
jgi:hypothetical protein